MCPIQKRLRSDSARVGAHPPVGHSGSYEGPEKTIAQDACDFAFLRRSKPGVTVENLVALQSMVIQFAQLLKSTADATVVFLQCIYSGS